MTHTESFGRGRIVDTILSGTAVPFALRVSKLPVSDNQYLTINPDSDSEEIFYYTTTTGTAGEAGTIQITGRGYNVQNDTQDAGNQKAHDENSEFKLALNHIIINDKADKSSDNIFTADIQFTWTDTVWLNGLNNLTTTQRDLLSPNNGAMIYNTTDNLNQQYVAGAWVNVGDTGTPDASETVAGKVEMATQAQYDARTATGETGALLVPQMGQLPIAATTTTEWLVELATDAEALAGTDEVRYVNSKQVKDNYEQLVNVWSFARDLSTATGALVIAHGLARVPKKISFIYSTDSTWFWPYAWVSVGTWINMTYWLQQSSNDTFSNTQCILFWSATAYNGVTVTAIDATNFTLTWTKTGSPTGTLNVIWTAEA